MSLIRSRASSEWAPTAITGSLTVLYADRVPGLQIVGPDDQWHDVMPAPDSMLVNLGDLLAHVDQ